MRRVSVVGNAGAGKTTLAAALATRLAVPHIEIDALFHGPGWQPPNPGIFAQHVQRAVAGPAWVADGNYSTVLDLVWERADTVVWLDLPRAVVMRQVVARTVTRLVRRTELWNGNREPWRNLGTLDPDRSIIAWAWTRHPVYRERYARRLADPRWARLEAVRLRSRHQTDTWLSAIPLPSDDAGGA